MPHAYIPIAPYVLTTIGGRCSGLRGTCIAVVNVKICVLCAGNGIGIKMQLSRLAARVDSHDLPGKFRHPICAGYSNVWSIRIDVGMEICS